MIRPRISGLIELCIGSELSKQKECMPERRRPRSFTGASRGNRGWTTLSVWQWRMIYGESGSTFYVRDLFRKGLKSWFFLLRDRRGEVIEFPKNKTADSE